MSADTLWYKDAVFYERHVKALQDSSGDAAGDFAGLIQRLDYVIWLLPFYSVSCPPHGYDIATDTASIPATAPSTDSIVCVELMGIREAAAGDIRAAASSCSTSRCIIALSGY